MPSSTPFRMSQNLDQQLLSRTYKFKMLKQFDFAAFKCASTPAERNTFCRDLVSALRQSGCIRLINHEVPDADIDQAFKMVQMMPWKLDPIAMSIPTDACL